MHFVVTAQQRPWGSTIKTALKRLVRSGPISIASEPSNKKGLSSACCVSTSASCEASLSGATGVTSDSYPRAADSSAFTFQSKTLVASLIQPLTDSISYWSGGRSAGNSDPSVLSTQGEPPVNVDSGHTTKSAIWPFPERTRVCVRVRVAFRYFVQEVWTASRFDSNMVGIFS